MVYRLSVTLESDTLFGAGRSGPGEVDTDSTFDEYGLPCIPGRRLKGLLVNAVYEFCRRIGPKAIQKFDTFPSLSIDGEGATLPGVAAIRKKIEVLRSISEFPQWMLSPDEIAEGFSTRRRQTAIEFETRIAKTDTLRVGRLVKKGTSFEAMLRFPSATPAQDAANWVTVMMAALSVGVGGGLRRHRGKGELAWKITGPESNDTNEEAPPAGSQSVTVRLELGSPLFVRHSAQGNDQVGDDFPAGRTLWSLYASRWWAANRDKDRQKAFSEYYGLFLSGKNRFSDAYLVTDSGNAQATPADLYLGKDDEKGHRLTDTGALPEKSGPLARWGSRFLVECNGWIEPCEPQREIRQHQRYSQESLSGQQLFEFTITGPKAGEIAKEVPPGDIKLGKSRTAEYGQVRLSYVESDISQQLKVKDVRGNHWRIELMSPMAIRSPSGWFDLQAKTLSEALARHLRVRPTSFRAFLKTGLRSGFQGNVMLPVDATPIYEVGTVLYWQFEKGVAIPALGSIEGMGREWGWGNFACQPREDEAVVFSVGDPVQASRPEVCKESILPKVIATSMKEVYLRRLTNDLAARWCAWNKKTRVVREHTASGLSVLIAKVKGGDFEVPDELAKIRERVGYSNALVNGQKWPTEIVEQWNALQGEGILACRVESLAAIMTEAEFLRNFQLQVLKRLRKELKAEKGGHRGETDQAAVSAG